MPAPLAACTAVLILLPVLPVLLPPVLPVLQDVNAKTLTYDGVDACGDRLVGVRRSEAECEMESVNRSVRRSARRSGSVRVSYW